MTDLPPTAPASQPLSPHLPDEDEHRVTADTSAAPARSLRADAWDTLKSNPLFWIASFLILLFTVMAIAPGLFTNTDPAGGGGDLSQARQAPSGEAWFGRDIQGYDLYSRCIYGARASILVGLFATLGTALLGVILGVVAGYSRGWIDGLLSRFAEVFFGVPLILGAIIILTALRGDGSNNTYAWIIAQVVIAQVILGWPSIFRLMRGSVLQVAPNDYIQAARALGASPLRVIRSHIIPNALAPVIVVATINLGAFIAAEAALSFLGIGLRPPTISWGIMIDEGSSTGIMRTAPHVLLFPALFLSLAVLAFIMLGDAIRDAFDPKSR